MKVAYALSGYLRNYKYNNFFENMVAEVPGDVFIHTWNELVPGTPLDIKDVCDYYKPAGLMIEDQFKFKQSLRLFGYEDYLQNYVCMWRGIHSAINMALEYDVIVRFRPDMVAESVLSKEEILHCFKTETPYIGASDDCYYANIVTDNFAFGKARFMESFAAHYHSALKRRQNSGSNERALTKHLTDSGWQGWISCSSLKYRIKRMDGLLVPNSQTIAELAPDWGMYE